MKTQLALSVAFGAAALASSAVAADLGTYAPTFNPMSYNAAAYDWNGFYAGLNGGYSWGDANLTDPAGTPIPGVDLNPAGFSGGGQVGFNMDMGGFVLGAETDLQLSNIGATHSAGSTYTSKVDYFGTFRGRIGVPLEGVLPYLTGGLAYGNNTTTSNATGPTTTETKFHLGYTVGGGVEVAVSDTLSVKGEYLYTALGKQSYALGAPLDNDVNFHSVRVGVNFAF